jgi:hypothetical protein
MDAALPEVKQGASQQGSDAGSQPREPQEAEIAAATAETGTSGSMEMPEVDIALKQALSGESRTWGETRHHPHPSTGVSRRAMGHADRWFGVSIHDPDACCAAGVDQGPRVPVGALVSCSSQFTSRRGLSPAAGDPRRPQPQPHLGCSHWDGGLAEHVMAGAQTPAAHMWDPWGPHFAAGPRPSLPHDQSLTTALNSRHHLRPT